MNHKNLNIEQVKNQHEMELMNINGVEGVGIGEEEGHPVIKVYVAEKTRELQQRLPNKMEGYPVRIEVTGEFHSLPEREG